MRPRPAAQTIRNETSRDLRRSLGILAVGMRLHWWAPRRRLRTAATEMLHHGPSWARLVTRGSFTNFGDEVSPLILREVTGQAIEWAPLHSADVIAVGSIIE